MEAQADSGSLTEKLGLGGLKDAAGSFASSLVNNGIGKVSDRVEGLSGKLTDFTEGKSSGPSIKDKAVSEGIKAKVQGKSPALAAVGGALSGMKDKVKDTVTAGAQALTGRGGKGSRKQKLVNIVEWVDVGVPVRVAYNQWTEFEEWSDFMKKVKNVEHDRDNGKVSFKGQVFLSHRTWESQIKEMVPDDRIIWKSKGQKGHLDGAVTFHEYGPRLTKICAVVEYYPQGFFEKTAQIWRAVGRRVRVELKRYVRHVMTSTIVDPEAAEGWRGEIRDGEVVRTHEEVVEEEQRQAEEQRRQEEQGEEEGQPQGAEEQPEGEEGQEEGRGEGEYEEGEEPEDEYGEEPVDRGREDEYEEEDEEEGEPEEGEEPEDEFDEEEDEEGEYDEASDEEEPEYEEDEDERANAERAPSRPSGSRSRQ